MLGIYVNKDDGATTGRLYAVRGYREVPANGEWKGSALYHRFELSPAQAVELVRGVCQHLTAEELRDLLGL